MQHKTQPVKQKHAETILTHQSSSSSEYDVQHSVLDPILKPIPKSKMPKLKAPDKPNPSNEQQSLVKFQKSWVSR
jgi:hypothetical protein